MINLIIFQDHNSTYALKLIEKSIFKSVKDSATTNLSVEMVKRSAAFQALMKKPLRIVVVNEKGYGDLLRKSSANLLEDGCCHDLDVEVGNIVPMAVPSQSSSSVGKAIDRIRLVMKKVEHGLYKGDVYRRVPGNHLLF